tara:strand:+ start:366 stop:638 length:273 start_codon:yes stop_codon:yes gene_type:complete
MKVRICYTTYVDDSCRKKISSHFEYCNTEGELANRAQIKEYLEQFGLSSIQEDEESDPNKGERYNTISMDATEKKDLYPLITKILNMWRK